MQCINSNFSFLLCRLFWSLVEHESKSEIISSFLTVLQSEAFFKLLTVLTDLELAILGDAENNENNENKSGFSKEPSCIIETRLLKHGCFTILDDQQFDDDSCLDCIFDIGCEGM